VESVVNDEEAIDKCVEELPAPSKWPQRHLLPSIDLVPTRGPFYPLVFRMKYT
jgi:hypothetical protein